MSMKPRLSIVVPVYNVEKYLKKCIDSLLKQTYTDFEIILVNDGSMDNSSKICDEYSKKYNQIKVIHKKNGGLADARNIGIDNASGELIGFIDSDDYIDEDMYEKLINKLDEYNCRIAMCGRYDVYKDNVIPSFTLKNDKKFTAEEAIKNILTWNNMDSSSCDKIFYKDLFSNIKFPVGRLNEDIFVMYKLIHNAGGIVHIGDPKYYYVHREKSITTNSFTPRKMDFPVVANEINEFVNKNYISIKEESEYFQFKSNIFIINVLLNEGSYNKYNKEFNSAYNYIIMNKEKLIKNKNISKKEKNKIKLMSIGKGNFIIIMKLYNKIRGNL